MSEQFQDWLQPGWSQLGGPASGQVASAAGGRIHLVGIGGIGMSGIAEVLLTLGYSVSGSDLHESEATRRLAGLGAVLCYGHAAEAVESGIDVVVVSSAIGDGNPEVGRARELHIPVIPRAEMLAELMRTKCGVAVAGAHGKTTTTFLLSSVLAAGGFDPTMVVGGRLKSLGGTNARLGRSAYMVAEADESDGSFLLLRPSIAVVTNIDREHMDYYGTMQRLTDAYVSFVNGIPFYGRAVLSTDCERVCSIIDKIKKRYTTYGTTADAGLRAVDVEQQGLETSFDVIREGRRLGRATVPMPGRHSVLNALAAIAVGLEFGMSFEVCAGALASFEGILRRFEVKGESGGVMVVDDYGHHPTEIRATLAAARIGLGRRIVAVFQPHRYTRTADLFDDFSRAFADADEVVVTDVYAAGEAPIEGAQAKALAEAIDRCHSGTVHYREAGPALAAEVARLARRGDVVITLGAGDITRLGAEILRRLAAS
ncbi:MAG: UDP-N-acetylmuramate--L-alanine ligase [Deltaproteobacteria bacterium]